MYEAISLKEVGKQVANLSNFGNVNNGRQWEPVLLLLKWGVIDQQGEATRMIHMFVD